MEIKKDSVYLEHIRDAIDAIESYVGQDDFETFKQTQKMMSQDAVIRQLEIIGEATKNLSPDFRDKITEIGWQQIAGMRDKLIHGYFEVDLEIVWKTVKENLPELKRVINKYL